MKDNLFLSADYITMLTDIFNARIPNCKVVAYGSRIKGTAHSGSDLDLAIFSIGEKIPLSAIREDLSESNIPFFVDIFDFAKLPQNFQDEIMAKNVEIYPL